MENRKLPQRIAPLPNDEWTDAARDVFGFWEGEKGRANGSKSATMMTLANHPKLALRVLKLGKYILVDSTLTLRQRELIILRVSWRYGCGYEWAHHVFSGRKLGMTDAEFEALQAPELDSTWTIQERILLSATDQLCACESIDDGTWSVLATSLTRHQVMDFLFTVGFIQMNAGALVAMGVQLEPDFEAFSTPVNEMKHIRPDAAD